MATWVAIHVKVNVPENVQPLFESTVFYPAPTLLWVNLHKFFDIPVLLEMGQGSLASWDSSSSEKLVGVERGGHRR